METITPSCAHLKPKIEWEDVDGHGFYAPHVYCENCHALIPDSDPIAQHYIQEALKGLETHEGKAKIDLKTQRNS